MNGKTVNAEVVVVDGRSYVDIDSLAQIADITNGSMTVEPNRITLTIPGEGSGGAPPLPKMRRPKASLRGLCRDFPRGSFPTPSTRLPRCGSGRRPRGP